ncbi:substrate-binding periplasmic protein [Rubellicoccus peritrichatus]|uniref:Transporter substrate-binding domain-containing protein n=1 Tax=Rubellicoccus peritrichatus TaxID=3080537 RepID=A0AAQ3QS16_9BACT|nr:transporter substrate-binding domain-containing protein [Puniceicoccus sp. CR14]WOO39871.1 transporter substrate-binding domain-containing protein [Puniceicoccus sp. CR14]
MKFRFLLAILLLPFAAFGQSGLSPFKTEPLKVGITADSPPLVFKAGNELQGIEIEFAKMIGKEIGRPIQFVELPWEEQIPALVDGKTDIIMSGMTITKDRSKEIDFSEPYVEYGQMALVKDADRTRYPNARSIMSTRGSVAVIPGTTGATFVESFFPNAEVKPFGTPDEATKAVVKGEADVFIYDSPTILWLGGEYEQEQVGAIGINLTVEYLGWGMRKDDKKLQKEVANAMAKLNADGQIGWVLDRWLPKRPKF